MSLWRKNARLPCNAPGTPVRVPVRTELDVEQTKESGEDVSAHADLQNADICPIPALKPSLRQLSTQRARRRFFAKVPATVGTTAGALQKSICYFDNCICHQSCNC